jgi:uncharacterized protein YecT (DUF1311 family)
MKILKLIISVALASSISSSSLSAEDGDPCGSKNSNAEMAECYSKEQARVTAEADSLARKVAIKFCVEAQKEEDGPVVAELMRKAALSLTRSQTSWKAYRYQHCRAVQYTWTTGSGAGTAFEACLSELGKERLRELRSEFKGWAAD